ncbi:MAG TPA: hypothetical protein VFN65_01725 [Solirubrobacteraceae bacterium]|nr:hypothetical protein [Solirubrobacteraceae bacterium]
MSSSSANAATHPRRVDAPLNDPALPLHQRLRAFGQVRAADLADDSGLAVLLAFIAACLRTPQARTPEAVARAYELLAGLYPEHP